MMQLLYECLMPSKGNLIDTYGDGDRLTESLERIGMNLIVLETRKIGVENILAVVLDSINQF